jgi:DME family drug/metabolite transporter
VANWPGMALPLHADVLAVTGYLGVVPTVLAYAAYLRSLADAHPVCSARCRRCSSR